MNITNTTRPRITYGFLIIIKSCKRMVAFAASSSVGKMISPAALRLSDSSDANTKLEATNIPSNDPIGLNACERFKRRVAVSLEPNDKINGLAVVSKNAKPNVNT